MYFGTQSRRSRETATKQANRYRQHQFEGMGLGRKVGPDQLYPKPANGYVRYRTDAEYGDIINTPSLYCPLNGECNQTALEG